MTEPMFEIVDYDPDDPDLPQSTDRTCQHPDGEDRDLTVVSGQAAP